MTFADRIDTFGSASIQVKILNGRRLIIRWPWFLVAAAALVLELVCVVAAEVVIMLAASGYAQGHVALVLAGGYAVLIAILLADIAATLVHALPASRQLRTRRDDLLPTRRRLVLITSLVAARDDTGDGQHLARSVVERELAEGATILATAASVGLLGLYTRWGATLDGGFLVRIER